jgi:hypothetical protein
VRAHARLRPRVLFGAGPCRLKAQTNARACGEIECGSSSTKVEPYIPFEPYVPVEPYSAIAQY